MIKIYGGGQLWGLSDPSPFVTKTYFLCKMAGIEYETAYLDFEQAPKGKIPYIEYNGTFLGDSSFIRLFLEKEFNADFNGNYSAEKLAIGWALEKLCEDHLYWIVLRDRWIDDENFNIGPRVFFDKAPEAMREAIIAQVREDQKVKLKAQGLGRHNDDELFLLAKMDIDAIEAILGDNNFILGNEPCGYDGMIYASLQGAQCRIFKSQIGDYIVNRPKLMAYIKRVNQLYGV